MNTSGCCEYNMQVQYSIFAFVVSAQTCLVVIFEQHKESAVKFASEFFSKIQQESQVGRSSLVIHCEG